MYRKHFALTSWPFNNRLHSDQMFQHDGTREAEARIRHLLELRGIGLLTGAPGCGKTTVCRMVCDSLNKGLYQVCYINLSTGSVLDIYRVLAQAFGQPDAAHRVTNWRAIRREIVRLVKEARQTPLLIFDEAHHLSNEALEELRLLTNFRMDSDPRLCLLLVGSSELRQRLAMRIHESLNQRIVMRCHVDPLKRPQVEDYIAHRLRIAGAEVPIFEADAFEALALASNGLPRRIDRLAHIALHAAANNKVRNVTARHVEQAVQESGP